MASVVVTGATGTIGRTLATALSKQGYGLGLAARDLDLLRELGSNLPGRVSIRQFDFDSDFDGIPNLMGEFQSELGDVFALVSAHGILNLSPLRSTTSEEWSRVFKVNFFSNVELIRAFRSSRTEMMAPNKVVLLSSVAAQRGAIGLSHYSASKAALESLARSAATEFARDNILVNSLQLGLLDGGMGSQIEARLGVERFSTLRAHYPLGLGQSSDVVGAVSFLLSNDSNWVTGSNIRVDGGFSVA